MRQVLYALFPSAEEAGAAVADAVDRGLPTEHFSVILHREEVRDAEELEVSETDAREGVLDGALIGALAGLLTMGVLVAPAGGLVGAGAVAAAALGLSAGGAYGALATGLAALGMPDRSITPLLAQVGDGKVLLTVTVANRGEEELVEATFARHGAIEARKHAL